jgi:multisubunit Na+/H+ antiporter MnhC subunit
VVLDEAAVVELERRLTAVCPALRNEGFLPQWEYSAEHKLPIVPEPLGLASLGHSEKRADPLPALFALTAVVLTAVAILLVAIIAPPWVPGR